MKSAAGNSPIRFLMRHLNIPHPGVTFLSIMQTDELSIGLEGLSELSIDRFQLSSSTRKPVSMARDTAGIRPGHASSLGKSTRRTGTRAEPPESGPALVHTQLAIEDR
jgi:hypothetical protein